MAEIGLRVLWPTEEDTVTDSIQTDIVFVHGLRGGREKTWKEKSSTILWPRDLLKHDVPNARVMTWGYDADVMKLFEPSGQSSIFGHAMQLLSDLQARRRSPEERVRPIIFVAHSLGGLVVKDALWQSHSEGVQRTIHRPRLAAVKPATIGVIFAGTPHRGSNKAKWASISANLAKVVLKDENDKLIQALKRGSEILERLQSDFSKIIMDLPIYTFFEDLEYPGIGKIVDNDSASLGFPNERLGSIPANHRLMVKFQSREDVGYQRIKDAILDLIEDWQEKNHQDRVKGLPQDEMRLLMPRTVVTYSGNVMSKSGAVVQGDQVAERGNITFNIAS